MAFVNRNLGDKIQVNELWYKPAYPLTFRTQYETRAKDKNFAPYTGQNIPEFKDKCTDFESSNIHAVHKNLFETEYLPEENHLSSFVEGAIWGILKWIVGLFT